MASEFYSPQHLSHYQGPLDNVWHTDRTEQVSLFYLVLLGSTHFSRTKNTKFFFTLCPIVLL